MSLKTYLLSVLVVLCFQVQAQQPSYRIYSTEDGLPSDELYDVTEDHLGEIWITSDRGIARYDGYRFKTYTTREGLASNTNFMLYRDRQQRLWTNSVNGLLSCFSQDSFRVPKGQEIIAKYNTYTTFILSKNLNPVVPIRSFMADLNYITGDIRAFYSNAEVHHRWPEWYELSNNGFKQRLIDTSKVLRNGRFYMLEEGHDQALIWIRGAGVLKAQKTPIGFLLFTHKQLILWNTTTNTLTFSRVFTDLLLQNVFVDSTGRRLMVSTRSGLSVFPAFDITKEPTIFLPQFNFTSSVRDREGNFWLSTWNQGLVKIPCIDLLNLGGHSLLGPERALTLLVHQGRLFLGNSESRVYAIDEAHRITPLDPDNSNSGDQNKPIEHFAILGDTLWSSYGKAWRIGNGSQQSLKPFFESARSAFRDHHYNYYIGYRVNRIWQDKQPGEFPKPLPPLISKRMFSAIETEDGETWLGTSDGLYLLKGLDTQRVHPQIGGQYPLKGRITDLKEIPGRKVLLVATRDAGLAIRYGKSWLHVGPGDVLVSPMINRIFVESENLVWLCTNKGANRLHLKYQGNSLRIDKTELFSVEQGLPSGFVNDIAVFGNRYYFATNKGLSYIPVNLLAPGQVPPTINLLQLSTTDSVYPNLAANIVIGPWLNDIAIQFSAISFRKPAGAAFYRYRIKGPELGNQWTYTDQTSIRLLNLDPGHYSFELQARNNNHVWCSSQILHFSIRPGFTQTWMFPVVLALLLLAGILAAFLIYRRNERKKNLLNQQIKDAQLQQKTTELELLRNQMNPHFIYNSLNSIQSYVHKGDFEGANDYIVRFSVLMRDTLNFSRLDLVSLEKELEFLENYLHLEQKRFADKFTYQIIKEDDTDPEDLLLHPLLLQPLIENAVKHAFRGIGYAGQITLRYHYLPEKHCIAFNIEDNGKGFLPGEPSSVNAEKSYGLQIVQRRLQILAEQHPEALCSMQIFSDGGSTTPGTRILLHIPAEPKWN